MSKQNNPEEKKQQAEILPRLMNQALAKKYVFFSVYAIVFTLLLAYLYKALLTPLVISLFLTYILSPLVNSLDRFKVPRVLIVSFLLATTLGVLAIFFIRFIPPLYLEIIELIKMIPRTSETFIQEWLPTVKEFVMTWDLLSPEEFNEIIAETRNLSHASDRLGRAVSTIWNTAPQVLGTMLNIVMVPLLTFFMLKDSHAMKALAIKLVPIDLKPAVLQFSQRVSDALRTVISGQLIVAAVMAVLYIFGLSLAGMHASVAIGLLAGVCRIIPYLDVIIGGGLSIMSVLANFEGPAQFVAVGIVFLAVQSIDGMFLTPRLIGVRVGLHPILVIVSILSFGDLFGFWGVLLAIPLLAVAKVLWQTALPFYVASQTYLGERDRRAGPTKASPQQTKMMD